MNFSFLSALKPKFHFQTSKQFHLLDIGDYFRHRGLLLQKSFIDKAIVLANGEEIPVPVMAYVSPAMPPTGWHRKAAHRFVARMRS